MSLHAEPSRKRLRRLAVTKPALAESVIQVAVFAHLRQRGAPGVVAFHPRNGAPDQQHMAGINAGRGVVSGMPDVIAIKGGATFALELKTNGGALSAAQRTCHEALRAAGATVGVSYGLDQALQWLERCGLLRGRSW